MARCNVLVAVVVMLAVAGLQQQQCEAGLVDGAVSAVTSKFVLKNACDQTVTILDVVGKVLAVVAPGTEVTVTTLVGDVVTLVLANGRKAIVPLSVGHGRRRLRADNGDLTFSSSIATITVTGTSGSGFYVAEPLDHAGSVTTGTISFKAD